MSTLKEKTLFDILNAIFLKSKIDYEKRIAPAYILSLWLSHDKELLPIVNEINMLQFNLEDEMVFNYYYHKVPKGKRFIRWPKKTEKDKQEQKIIESLQEKYGISKREAKLCLAVTVKNAENNR